MLLPSTVLLILLNTFTAPTAAQDYSAPPENARQMEKKILDDILGSNTYDARIRPSGTNSTGKFSSKLIET